MMNKLLRKVRSIDKYGQKPAFKMRFEGGGAYVSYMGALCSAIFISISLIFLYSKIMVLVEVSAVTVIPNLKEGALTFNDKFTADDGFFIAVALTKFDSETEPLDDPRHGELLIEHYGWGNGGDDIGTVSRTLESHSCSDAELGLVEKEDGDNGDLVSYPIFES